MSDLDLARQYCAEELRALANLQSEALVKAFANANAHEPVDTCWLHGEGFCLSKLTVT
jgi:hypothetical protein